jgi:hypothetical protein
MFKKMTVLAMALGVVAAMALPGTASASWKHNGVAIPENVQIGLTGQVEFQSEIGGISCQVTSAAKFLAGQTNGQAETFVPHPTNATTNCTGEGGLSQCQVETVQPTNLPWTFTTTGVAGAPTIQIHFGDIHGDLFKKNLFCPFEHSTVTAGTAVFTPTPSNGIDVTSVKLSGSTQGHLYSTTPPSQDGSNQTTAPLTLGGTLNVESPNSGTYDL